MAQQTQAQSRESIDRTLYDAAEAGNVPEVQRMLTAGADPNYALPFWNHRFVCAVSRQQARACFLRLSFAACSIELFT